MFDSMRVTNQIVPKNRQLIKRKEDDAANKQTTEAESENGGTNLAQSRGLQYVQDLQNGKKPSKPVNLNGGAYAYNPVAGGNFNRPTRPMGGASFAKPASNVSPQPQATTQPQNASKPLSSMISPKINIAQVIGDFKNTASAIGTPEDIFEEVNDYLGLVEKQTKKDNANIKLVQSNLKNAATLLDKYISETLNKDSKVVENWVDAIFLQQVDYKYNEGDVNEAFLVQMPDDKKKKAEVKDAPKQEEQLQVAEKKPSIDGLVKNLFTSAKLITKKGNDELAISTYQKAIDRCHEINDKDNESKILFEIGKIHDKNDNLNLALENYNNAINTATNDNVKVQAHYAMAQIYDDVNQFKPAIEHYMAAISFAGETENFKAQIKSLTKIGNIYSDKYDKEAFNVYEDAKVVADESKDSKNKGYVSSTIASAYDKFNKPTEALKYYSDAVKNYAIAGENNKVAINYKKAGELMIDYQKGDKGKNLIQKAIEYAKKANNEKLISELKSEIAA